MRSWSPRRKLRCPLGPLGVWLLVGLLLGGCASDPLGEAGSRSLSKGLALEDSAATSANVSIGDVNADGHDDIVLVKGRHWPLDNLVLLGDGAGGFQPAYPLGGGADRSYSGDLVDLDRDGDLDVVVSNDDPDDKRVHLNDGTGRFRVGSTFGEGRWPTRHVGVADFDGDGFQDVVLANRYGAGGGPSYVCFGVEGGRFEGGCVAVTEGSATTITPADVNGDGAVDLVVPHRDGGQSFVYLNDGRGGFGERRPFGPDDATIRSAEAADLDGDGITDLAVIDERRGGAVFRGRLDGSYGEAEPLAEDQPRPYALALADLDRNGRTDVLVGYVQARPVVYFNDASDRFTPVAFGDDEGSAYGFAVGDLDEDGFLDIAVARSGAVNMLYFGEAAPPDTGTATRAIGEEPSLATRDGEAEHHR